VRWPWLIGQFQDKGKQGTYWGIGSAVTRYRSDAQPGYGKEFATGTVALIRTDMDAFSEAEIAVLMNHGYLLADIAVAVHTPQLIALVVEKRVDATVTSTVPTYLELLLHLPQVRGTAARNGHLDRQCNASSSFVAFPGAVFAGGGCWYHHCSR
jgi:hypothetical protein